MITFEHENSLPVSFSPPNVPQDLVSWLIVLLHLVLVILMRLSLWQPERFIKLVTEVSVEFQPLSLLFIQQEAIDVGVQLIRRHRGDEALSVQSALVQQHHAEVGSGDSEYLSAKKSKWAINQLLNAPLFTCELLILCFCCLMVNSDA